MKIEKVSLAVQIDGDVCFVSLSQANLKLLVQMSASFSKNGKINVVKASSDFKLEELR